MPKYTYDIDNISNTESFFFLWKHFNVLSSVIYEFSRAHVKSSRARISSLETHQYNIRKTSYSLSN